MSIQEYNPEVLLKIVSSNKVMFELGGKSYWSSSVIHVIDNYKEATFILSTVDFERVKKELSKDNEYYNNVHEDKFEYQVCNTCLVFELLPKVYE